MPVPGRARDRRILRAVLHEELAVRRVKAEKLLPAYQAVQKMEVAHTGPMVFGWDDGPESCPKCGYNMKDVSPVMS